MIGTDLLAQDTALLFQEILESVGVRGVGSQNEYERVADSTYRAAAVWAYAQPAMVPGGLGIHIQSMIGKSGEPMMIY